MNDRSEIAPELQSFLRDRITSYEQLEALLFLRGQSERSFSPADVAEALQVALKPAAEALEHLCQEDLLAARIGTEIVIYRYGPGTPELATLVDLLAEAYGRNRLAVMNLMNANAIERVRTEALHMFADAFIVGRKRGKDG